jgi:peptide/nickel transport system substrate-binding protein
MRERRPGCPKSVWAALRLGAALGLALLLGACAAESRVVVGLPSGPAAALPHGSVEEFTNSILSNVYETLVELDGGLGMQPGLAESWYTPDDHTWVFTLRERVALHDGRLLDAAMAAASITRARDDPASKRRSELAAVRVVEVRDARTLVLRTDQPQASLPARLVSIPIAVEPLEKGAAWVGSGAYRIRHWTEGGDVVLEAFPRHRRGEPSVRALEFRVVPAVQERVRRLRAGELDLTFDLPPPEIARLADVPSVRTLSARGLRVLFLGLRCAPLLPSGHKNPLHDVRVRKAVALAIDRDALVAGPLDGTAQPIGQIIAPGVVGYDEAIAPMRFSPESARRLLEEAGLPGFSMDLDYMPVKYRAMEAVVQALARDLAAVGIRATPRAWEPAAFFDRLERRLPSAYLLGWMSTNGDAGLTYEYLLHTPGAHKGVGNGGSFSDAELDASLDAGSTLMGAQREAALARVAARVMATVPVVPLYAQNELYAVAADLEFQPRLDRRIRGRDLRWRR